MDLTVIVPCYNSEKTIKKCIDSLITQTKEVKIIIVNDGSQDDTYKIAESYAENHPNIDVISHDNIGLPQSRQAGLRKVTTKWVAFVDSDDWVEPNMMEKLYCLGEKNDAEIAACGLYYDSENGTKISKNKIGEKICLNGKDAVWHLHKRSGVYSFMCNKIFQTSLLKQFDFPTGNFLGEDYATILPCLKRAERICVTSEPLYHYILHENSMSKSGYNSAYRKAFETYRGLFDLYQYDSDVSGNNNEMADYLCVELSAIYVAMIRNSNYDEEVVRYIRSFEKKYLGSLLKEENVKLYFKVSILLIAFAPSVFKIMYNCLKKFI